MGSFEFTPPYQDGWQDNEEGATPITADILNNNYDSFLLTLNNWITSVEGLLITIPENISAQTMTALAGLYGELAIENPTNGQVLKFNGSKWVNANESGGGGGSNVSWEQILQTGTKIGTITIDGMSYDVYAPTPITALNGLSDVVLTNPANGDVLQYNSNTSKWENKSISVGDSVEFTQILSSGVKIGTITIDGTDYDIYAPQGGGGSFEPNGVTYTIINNATEDVQSGQAARSIVVNKFEDNVQTDTGSLSYSTVVTTGPNNFTVGNVKTTYTLESGTAYWVLTVVSGHIQYNGTLYETGDEILRTPVSGSSVITLTDIEEMEESHSTVVWTQIQQSGTKIAEISIDGVSQNVYVPSGGGGGYTEVTGTLTAGQTEITLADPIITAASTFEPFTNKFGVNPTNMELIPGAESILQPLVESESELLGTITVSSTFSDYGGWKAFTSAGSWVGEGNIDQWFAYEFPTNVMVSKIQWICDDTSRRGIVTNIQYSNDGSTWNNCTLLKNETGDVEISGANSAKHWRLFFAAPFGSWTEPMIRNLEFIAVVNGVKLTFPVQSENLNVKVRVS